MGGENRRGWTGSGPWEERWPMAFGSPLWIASTSLQKKALVARVLSTPTYGLLLRRIQNPLPRIFMMNRNGEWRAWGLSLRFLLTRPTRNYTLAPTSRRSSIEKRAVSDACMQIYRCKEQHIGLFSRNSHRSKRLPPKFYIYLYIYNETLRVGFEFFEIF